MDLVLRNRRFSEDDLVLIRSVVEQYASRGRQFIGQELCRQWQWVYPNGAPKIVACWEALRRLEAKGLIHLPPRRGGSTAPKRKWRQGLSTAQQVRPLWLPLNISPGTIAPLVSEGVHWRLAISGSAAVLYRELMQAPPLPGISSRDWAELALHCLSGGTSGWVSGMVRGGLEGRGTRPLDWLVGIGAPNEPFSGRQ